MHGARLCEKFAVVSSWRHALAALSRLNNALVERTVARIGREEIDNDLPRANTNTHSLAASTSIPVLQKVQESSRGGSN
jgi:hypothetical protein